MSEMFNSVYDSNHIKTEYSNNDDFQIKYNTLGQINEFIYSNGDNINVFYNKKVYISYCLNEVIFS